MNEWVIGGLWLVSLATVARVGVNIREGLAAVSAQIGHHYCEIAEWRKEFTLSLEEASEDDHVDGEMACDHVKVFSDYILTSNPPQQPWICTVCGEKGTARGDYHRGPTYEELVRKFASPGA